MLKDIPIDVLKIDKGFLSEAVDNNRRNIIFSSIADMAARKLNIKVVVEGVEHLENVRLMKECGSIAQGYYFAKPMDEKASVTYSKKVGYAEEMAVLHMCGDSAFRLGRLRGQQPQGKNRRFHRFRRRGALAEGHGVHGGTRQSPRSGHRTAAQPAGQPQNTNRGVP